MKLNSRLFVVLTAGLMGGCASQIESALYDQQEVVVKLLPGQYCQAMDRSQLHNPWEKDQTEMYVCSYGRLFHLTREIPSINGMRLEVIVK